MEGDAVRGKGCGRNTVARVNSKYKGPEIGILGTFGNRFELNGRGERSVGVEVREVTAGQIIRPRTSW